MHMYIHACIHTDICVYLNIGPSFSSIFDPLAWTQVTMPKCSILSNPWYNTVTRIVTALLTMQHTHACA